MKNKCLSDGNVVKNDVINNKIFGKSDNDVVKLKIFENGGC